MRKKTDEKEEETDDKKKLKILRTRRRLSRTDRVASTKGLTEHYCQTTTPHTRVPKDISVEHHTDKYLTYTVHIQIHPTPPRAPSPSPP